MKERPIPFSAPMVRALLNGSKTQTRRVMKVQPVEPPDVAKMYQDRACTKPVVAAMWTDHAKDGPDFCLCPYGVPGDRLWVREAWRTTGDGGRCNDMPPRDLQPHEVWHEADGFPPSEECAGKLRPGMFMPRWASRITLEVTSVRVERLSDISEADALAEGVETWAWGALSPDGQKELLAAEKFELLWCGINGRESWDANPWVWCVEFKRAAT